MTSALIILTFLYVCLAVAAVIEQKPEPGSVGARLREITLIGAVVFFPFVLGASVIVWLVVQGDNLATWFAQRRGTV